MFRQIATLVIPGAFSLNPYALLADGTLNLDKEILVSSEFSLNPRALLADGTLSFDKEISHEKI